jgi:quercetin dioxygenase-like cupin family protein
MPRTTLVHPDDRPEESWDDPAKGPIRWRTLLSQGLTDTDSFTVGIAVLRKGEHWVAHRHVEPELYFGISGAFDVEVEGEWHRLRPEAALYIPGNALHSIPAVGEDVRFLYAFAADSFDAIAYEFPEVSP